MSIKTHRDLVAWQKSRGLVKLIYDTTRALPAEERFGLALQMRRAAVSIPSNIAEGFGRGMPGDFMRFLRMARGSLFELDTQLVLCGDLGYTPPAESVTALLEESDRVLQGLIRSVEDRSDGKQP